MFGGHNRRGPRYRRDEVIVYWLSHCNACGIEGVMLLEIPSRILGPGWYCQRCADQYSLHTAEQRAARAEQGEKGGR